MSVRALESTHSSRASDSGRAWPRPGVLPPARHAVLWSRCSLRRPNVIYLVSVYSSFLALLGGIAARPRASICDRRGARHLWGALAMGVTAGVGALFDAVAEKRITRPPTGALVRSASEPRRITIPGFRDAHAPLHCFLQPLCMNIRRAARAPAGINAVADCTEPANGRNAPFGEVRRVSAFGFDRNRPPPLFGATGFSRQSESPGTLSSPLPHREVFVVAM